MADQITELTKVVRAALLFANWAAGEGICPVDETVRAHEDFLFDYFSATRLGDTDCDYGVIAEQAVDTIQSAAALLAETLDAWTVADERCVLNHKNGGRITLWRGHNLAALPGTHSVLSHQPESEGE